MPFRHHNCLHLKYHMSCEHFDELRKRADGGCEICGFAEEELPSGMLYIDHDPQVGPWAVRGLLCNRCNSGFDLPALIGDARDAYLANPWYLAHPERPVGPAARAAYTDDLLRALDVVTAQSVTVGVPAVRAELASAIAAALKGGATPTEVALHSPYSQSRVRAIARIAGVPAASRGSKVKRPAA